MNVAMMQPHFLPWPGFFELVHAADRFILLDDFQFSLQSYHQRNRLFIGKGQVGWYSVPIDKKGSFQAPLNCTRISETGRWREKLWRRLEHNYGKAPWFSALGPAVKRWLTVPAESLASQNAAFIRFACETLELPAELRLSSARPSDLRRSERVLDLLRWCEADCYYSARGSFAYMAADGIFPVPGIEVRFQDFAPQPYLQVGSPEEFVPRLSVLDALFNVGPRATRELIAGGTRRWLAWHEMEAGARLPPGESGEDGAL